MKGSIEGGVEMGRREASVDAGRSIWVLKMDVQGVESTRRWRRKKCLRTCLKARDMHPESRKCNGGELECGVKASEGGFLAGEDLRWQANHS